MKLILIIGLLFSLSALAETPEVFVCEQIMSSSIIYEQYPGMFEKKGFKAEVDKTPGNRPLKLKFVIAPNANALINGSETTKLTYLAPFTFLELAPLGNAIIYRFMNNTDDKKTYMAMLKAYEMVGAPVTFTTLFKCD